MRRHTALLLTLPLMAAALALAACSDSPAGPTTNAPAAQPKQGQGDLLKAVRQQTARFNSTVQAIRAGYQPDDHCVSHPELGGMGYHWVNEALIDPVFEPLQPEVILYRNGAGGNLRVAGVEYIVIDVGQPRPHFDGHPFDVGGVPPLMEAGVPHWSLHVWVHMDNPSGVFAPFNPSLSCD